MATASGIQRGRQTVNNTNFAVKFPHFCARHVWVKPAPDRLAGHGNFRNRWNGRGKETCSSAIMHLRSKSAQRGVHTSGGAAKLLSGRDVSEFPRDPDERFSPCSRRATTNCERSSPCRFGIVLKISTVRNDDVYKISQCFFLKRFSAEIRKYFFFRGGGHPPNFHIHPQIAGFEISLENVNFPQTNVHKLNYVRTRLMF